MCVRLRVVAFAVACVFARVVQAAQPQAGVAVQLPGDGMAQPPMDLSGVLTRARERAPAIVDARLARDEIRGRLVDASLRRQTNPELDVQAGSRHGTGERWTDVEVGVTQAFEPGARRPARMAAARAGADASGAEVEEVTRSVLREAARAYYRAVHADERIRLLIAAEDVASGVHDTTDRRFRAGDVAVLDVNLTRAALARVRADRQAAEATKAEVHGELAVLLGLDADVAVRGRLEMAPQPSLEALLQASLGRPELRVLEAGIREAESDRQLAESFARPEYGIGARYAREEGNQVFLGGVTITLPVFAKGEGLRASANARGTRLRAALAAARTRAMTEVRTAFDAHQRRVDGVRALDAAAPGLDESDRLAARSFEVGQIGLSEWLFVRREVLDTRVQHLDALLEAALARVTLEASAGVLR